ncbi:MAG: class F sortase [Chloroflexi bacterium]|nr:class F sortase [Chloroflexota bacterium]MCL5108209.1 class F sortase [Chloroflexota bacterium]
MDNRSRRRPSTFLANLLIGLGVAIVLLATAGYGYNYWQEQQARADPWLARLEAAYARAAGSGNGTPTPSATAQPAPAAAGNTATPAPTGSPTPGATNTATPVPSYPEPVGMSIPSVGIESRVVSAGIKDGEYQVPKFYVGHYTSTANPGQNGNGVYVGHIESLSSGNVFANLPKVKVGAQIRVYTDQRMWTYLVTQVLVVPYNDLSVMNQTTSQHITLITCTGDWDVLSHQYTDRLVVIAEPAS